MHWEVSDGNLITAQLKFDIRLVNSNWNYYKNIFTGEERKKIRCITSETIPHACLVLFHCFSHRNSSRF